MVIFILFFLVCILIGLVSRNKNWVLYEFSSLFPVLPAYFALEFSESVPLLTAGRFMVIMLTISYMFSKTRKKLSSLLKSSGIYRYVLIYFGGITMVYLTHINDVPSEVFKSLLSIWGEQFLILLCFSVLIKDLRCLYKVLKIIVFTSAIISIFGIVESLTGFNIAYILATADRELLMSVYERAGLLRASVSFGHAVYFSQYLITVLPLTMYMYENSKSPIYLVSLFLNVLALIFTGSRGGIFAFGLIFFIMLLEKRNMIKKYLKLIIVGIVVLLFIFLLNFDIIDYFINILYSCLNVLGFDFNVGNFGTNVAGVSSRTMQFSGIEWLIKEGRLWLGFGPLTTTTKLLHYYTYNPYDGYAWRPSKTIDMGYLAFIFTTGVWGLVFSITLFFGVIFSSWRKAERMDGKDLNNAFKYSFLAFCIGMLTSIPLYKIYWTILALYVCYNHLVYQENLNDIKM